MGQVDRAPGPLRVVVAGATGFIGRHVCAAFRESGAPAVLFGLVRSEDTTGLLDGCLAATLGGGDSAALRSFVLAAAPDVIVNCAGAITTDPEAAELANVGAARDLIEACAACAPQARLVHVGSSAEYRPSAFGLRTREEDPTEPVTEYGRSKLRATEAVLQAHRDGRVRAVVLRLFNALGAGMAVSTLAGRMAAAVRDGREAELTVGRLDAYRDFVDVRDAARAVVAAAGAPAAVGGVINIGSGRARSAREVAEGIVARSPRSLRLVERGAGSARSVAVEWQEADIARARSVLDWSPRVPWEATLDYVVTDVRPADAGEAPCAAGRGTS